MDCTARPAHADLLANEGSTSYIMAATWHSTNAHDILCFLVTIRGVFLYNKVLGADPETSSVQGEEAMFTMSVDVITRSQRMEFLAQECLNFDESVREHWLRLQGQGSS